MLSGNQFKLTSLSQDIGASQRLLAFCVMSTAANCTHELSLSEQFARLPVELLLEVALHLQGRPADDSSSYDEPRSRHTSAYLLAMMSISRQLRHIARPYYWSEVYIDTKARWKKFALFLKINRFKKTQPVLDAKLVETLDLTLDPPSEDTGGLDSEDFAQMMILDNVDHLRVRVGKGVRLMSMCGTKTYCQHIGKLGRPLKPEDKTGGVTRLSIYSPIPQPLNHCFWLASEFPNLQHLVLDNVQGPMGPLPMLRLPALHSFKLRNSTDLKFSQHSGFAFLAECTNLKSLALQGCDFDTSFLRHVLTSRKKHLSTLELGTVLDISCTNRWELQQAHEQGVRSLETGWHMPTYLLEDPVRIGDEAAHICRTLTTLALGGPLYISPKLLEILNNPDRTPLYTLSLHDVGRQRPTRPDGDPSSMQEKELLEHHPAGISPEDLLHALEAGFHVPKLQLRGMGHEWQEELAREVKAECDRAGISSIR